MGANWKVCGTIGFYQTHVIIPILINKIPLRKFYGIEYNWKISLSEQLPGRDQEVAPTEDILRK